MWVCTVTGRGRRLGVDVMDHKPNFFTAGTLALLAFAGLTACASMTHGTMSPGTYATHGVSFHYPRGWHRGAPARCCRDHRLWSVRVGIDRVDLVHVTASQFGQVVTRQNLRVLRPVVVRTVRRFLRHAHGELIGGPHAITVGGMPGLRFAGTAKFHGTAAKATLVTLFNGSTVYGISCRFTPPKARAVRQACTQVLRTFKVGKLFRAGTALVYRKHGVSFDYPPSWAEGSQPRSFGGCRSCGLWAADVGVGADNAVDVEANRENTAVTRQNLPQATPYVTRAERNFFRHFGGRLLAGPRAITVGGMPGLLYRGTGNLFGTAVKVTEAAVFNGTTLYAITCSSTPSEAGAVHRACAHVLRTFRVTRPSRRE
jgi:hypothetical protein